MSYLSFKSLWPDFMDDTSALLSMDRLNDFPHVSIKQLGSQSIWSLITQLYRGSVSVKNLIDLLPELN